ncbi:MAG: thioredoxin family protein [Acidobacteria bacterium]|nr:thioredoxin family protein [Acidobacteriota bacterium]
MLSDDDVKVVKERFESLDKDIKIKYFSSDKDCQYCTETEQLLTELSDISDKISFHKFDVDSDEAKNFGVDKAPATIIENADGSDFGIKFYGIPSGYEFSTLMETIDLLSSDKLEIDEKLMNKISEVDYDVDLQVFVTPTCPYCPQGVLTAFALAYKNKNIKASMVEATEFPELSKKYGVMGVPRTVINDNASSIEGAAPLPMVLDKILELRQ